MEQVTISLLHSRVGHTRLWPKINSFLYTVFYIKVPIQKDMHYPTPFFFSFNKWNLFSMYTIDQGAKSEKKSWYSYITEECKKAGLQQKATDQVYLICHPRIFGFAFNPISYWLLLDKKNALKAVLCEVHNTFSQTHNYLIFKGKNTLIQPTDILTARKHLYVSPFNNIEGHYEFTFTYEPTYFKSNIRYFDGTNRNVLNTFIDGVSEKLTNKNILQSLIQYPAMTLMVVFRIHWQALKLFLKKIEPTLENKPRNYRNNTTTLSEIAK